MHMYFYLYPKVIISYFSVKLLLTPFRQMVMPPPMAAHTITFSSPVNQAAFGVDDKKHNLLVQCSNSISYARYNDKEMKYISSVVNLDDGTSFEEMIQLKHLVVLKDDFVAGLLVQKDKIDLLLFQFVEEKLNIKERCVKSKQLNNKQCLHVRCICNLKKNAK